MENFKGTASWDTRARAVQQEFYNNLSDRDWDKYKSNEQVYFLKNIGYALFGPPDEEPSSRNKETGFSAKKLKDIEIMCRVIKENDKHNSITLSKEELERNVSTLIEESSTISKPTTEEKMTRQFHISEICKMIDCYNNNDLQMLMKLHSHIASAIYATHISEFKLFQSYSSKELLPRIMLVFGELSSIIDQYRESDGTLVSVVFVVLKVEIEKEFHPIPEAVFRVPNDADGDGKVRFIDRNQRVYRGWEQYLENNKLQEGIYCYPVSGMYNGDEKYNVQVEFGKTPAGKTINKVLSAGDMVGTIVGVGASVVAVASLIPVITVAAPIMVGALIGGAATGAYSVGRGVGTIIDRSKHDQEMGLGNAEARNMYISIAGGSLGIFAMGATSATAMLAREGQVIGSFSRLVVNALQISSLTVNGVGIATAAMNLHEKYQEGNLTTLDVFQFSSNVLFFSMSAVNFRTAQTIIKDTQQSTLNDFRSNLRSNRHRKGFDKISRNSRQGLSPVEGNAKVIRSINNINSPDDFFSGVVRTNKHHNQGAAKLRLADGPGQVLINDAIKVDPSTFANINKADRINILDATKNLDKGAIDRARFDKIMTNVSAKYGMTFDNNKIILESKVIRAFGTNSLQAIDSTSEGTHFSKLSTAGLLVVDRILQNPNVTREILEVSIRHFAKLWDGVLPEDFAIRLEFTCKFIVEQVRIMEAAYQEALRAGVNLPRFNREQFDSDYGITGDRMKHFTECFVLMYSITKNIIEFRNAYAVYRENREQQ